MCLCCPALAQGTFAEVEVQKQASGHQSTDPSGPGLEVPAHTGDEPTSLLSPTRRGPNSTSDGPGRPLSTTIMAHWLLTKWSATATATGARVSAA
jgi:hypothetical protein